MIRGEIENNSSLPTLKPIEDFHNMVEDFYNNINWRKLHVLLTANSIKASPEVVSEILNVTIEEAVDAIEGLHDLGLLSKNGDKYEAAKMQFLIPESQDTREQRVQGHINQSRQILNQVDHNLDIGAWTHYIAASKEDMKWFRSKFFELVNKLEEKAVNSENKEI